MYQYDNYDHTIVRERVEQFRGQVQRRLDGRLTEEQFRPLRLQNGLYLQTHAYMLRVAIPYGLLNTKQLRALAMIARDYDKGYGHVSTRQNMQYNWPELEDVPDILQHLADVEMHAIQTSGNCIRNISSDEFAGVTAEELEDPRPYCEILRQWSTFHPEFAYLPRKFKIAVTGATTDRTAVAYHDIGLRLEANSDGVVGFKVYVGGGLGRTPVIGPVVREWIAKEDILSYCEAILRVYNLSGDRKNKYRARIKILVRTLGVDEFRRRVDEEWDRIREGAMELTSAEIDRVSAFFRPPAYDATASERGLPPEGDRPTSFSRWLKYNTEPHKVPGYRIVHVSLKAPDIAPGDITDTQMEALADIADAHSFGEVRTTHRQNMVLADVEEGELFTVWEQLQAVTLATPNIGTVTDMICCPGLDFCSLANASSISIADDLNKTFDQLDYVYDLGPVELKMSGCINACGHHHVGHIGILGISKAGEEFYQIMLGGSAGNDSSLGKWLGPAIAKPEIATAVGRLLERFVTVRDDGERFLDTYRRLGAGEFKEAVYG